MQVGNNAANEQLKSYVDRIEAKLEERANVNEDIRDIKVEARAAGFDARTIMEVIKHRKMKPEVREERKALLETYLAAFGIE